jgi:hypothetical protein
MIPLRQAIAQLLKPGISVLNCRIDNDCGYG